jgi:hypothetical protein
MVGKMNLSGNKILEAKKANPEADTVKISLSNLNGGKQK